MKIGIHIVNFSVSGGGAVLAKTLADTALAAEDAGLSHISMMDHFFQLELLGGAELDMLEGYTSLGYIAAKTEHIRLGLLVTGVTYRYPGLLAKIVTTLDILSEGRADFGVGAAWYDREHLGLGVPFPPLKQRFEQLEETLQICMQMWSENDGPFNGKHFQLDETRNVPQSLQRPHPPVMIGGMGEQKTLMLVAKYGNACNLFLESGPDQIAHKLDILRQHCRALGRDYNSIEKTILYLAPCPSTDQCPNFVDEMSVYAELGVNRVMVMPGCENPEAEVAALRPVVEALGSL